MTAIMLAGGESSRMGTDKAFLKIGNEALINRQLRLLKKLFRKIIIVTNSPQKYKNLKGINPVRNTKAKDTKNKISNGVKIIPDIIPHRGPLGGIYSGLLASGSTYNFVVACDMPFINEPLIRYMIKNMDNYDILVPRINGRFHPLFGIYSQNCISVIEKMLNRDRLKISNIFSKLRVRFISKRELGRFDKPLLSLENVNTSADLARVKKLRG